MSTCRLLAASGRATCSPVDTVAGAGYTSQVICYHGGPITPYSAAIQVWKNKHALVAWAAPEQLEVALEVAASVVIDNSAFTFWKRGGIMRPYDFYEFTAPHVDHPRLAFVLMPDVIGGSEAENDALLESWPFRREIGCPVWHLNESRERLVRLAYEYPRVAIGSCGDYDVSRPADCIRRLRAVLPAVCTPSGHPICKLHGLRMLGREIRRCIPLSSGDSSRVARNIGLDTHWRHGMAPSSKTGRALALQNVIENYPTATRLAVGIDGEQEGLF